jgi:hypothetical protein
VCKQASFSSDIGTVLVKNEGQGVVLLL